MAETPSYVGSAVDAVLEWWLTGTTDDAVLEWWTSDDAADTAEALVREVVQSIEVAGFEINPVMQPQASTPNPSRLLDEAGLLESDCYQIDVHRWWVTFHLYRRNKLGMCYTYWNGRMAVRAVRRRVQPL